MAENNNRVTITGKEIFNELREVHTKVNNMIVRMDDLCEELNDRGERIEKLERTTNEIGKQIMYVAGGAGLTASIMVYLLGRILG